MEHVQKELRSILFCSVFLLHAFDAFSLTKTWTGLAGDGLWASAANWNDHALPLPEDDVLLDQSVLLTDYQVQLPDLAAQVFSLRIVPSAGHTIHLLLPASSMASPGLLVMGSMELQAGAVFENASGIASGESLLIADSLRIYNGGKYIHRTRGAHAGSIVSHLSAIPGTETGIFEFDVPRSSYTISASNRIYGTLSLRADALGGPVNYTCSGSNPLTVRGDLRINENVQFSVDLSGPQGNLSVAGDFIESGGVFNLASGTGNSTVAAVSGNLIQAAGAVITATAIAQPVLALTGTGLQAVSLAGTVSGPIGFRLDNPAGALLVSPLTLPYSLELKSGRLISSNANLLSLATDCRVICDSAQLIPAYVDGPLKKYGLAGAPYFLFPTGKNGLLHWLEVKDGTGDFTAEYLAANPRNISGSCEPGLDHVSGMEYWQLQTSPSAAGAIELSYRVPSSGGVTDPSFLSVARLESNAWNNIGNAGITGDFSGGSVRSGMLSSVGSTDFTLGSTVNLENPLPLTRIDWRGQPVNTDIFFQWTTDLPAPVSFFELWCGSVHEMVKIDSIPVNSDSGYSCWARNQRGTDLFYQLRAVDGAGNRYLSSILHFTPQGKPVNHCRIIGNPVTGENVFIELPAVQKATFHWAVFTIDGKEIRMGSMTPGGESSVWSLPVGKLSRGMYVLTVRNAQKQLCSLPWLQQ